MKLALFLGLNVFLLLALASVGHSQSKGSLGFIETKAHLEELISTRVQATLATTLEKSAFNVSVEVNLVEAPVKKTEVLTKARSEKKVSTEDLSVGLVDANALIEKYEAEAQALHEQVPVATQSDLARSPYIVKAISVSVGVQDSLGDAYAKEIGDWLKKRLASDFKESVTTHVQLLKALPTKPVRPKGLLDYLTSLQILVACLLLSGVILLSVLLMKLMGSKDARESRKLTAQLQQNMRLQQEQAQLSAEKSNKDEREFPEDDRARPVELEMTQSLQEKVYFSAADNVAILGEVFQSWMENGERGFFKTAMLIDVLMSLGRQKNQVNSTSSFDWSNVIPAQFRKKMRGVYEKIAIMGLPERIRILEELYWDLISIKTLGNNSLVQPFQFVSSVPMPEIRTLLANQNSQMKALAVLHMSDDLREDYVRKLSFDGKKEMVEQVLQMEKVLSTDIDVASETLKFEVKKTADESKTVSLRSMTPKLLEAMSAIDEIQLLKDLCRKLSDGGIYLKRSFPSLAFLHEWPQSTAKMVLSQAGSDEALAFLRMMPEQKDVLLTLLPPRVQTIVADDLGRADTSNGESKERALSALKLKMLQVMNRESIQLEEIFPENAKGGLRAAS